MSDLELEALTNELFRRAGRNLLNFQRLERMLKLLLAKSTGRGPLREMPRLMEARSAEVHRSTMGILAGKLVKDMLSGPTENDEGSDEAITEIYVRHSARVDLADEDRAELTEKLRTMVEERNFLAHHLNEHWDSRSLESTQAMLARLESQREALLPVYAQVHGILLAHAEIQTDLARLLQSSEFEEWLLQSQDSPE